MSEKVRKGAKDIEKERKRAKKTWWFSLNLPCPVMYSTEYCSARVTATENF